MGGYLSTSPPAEGTPEQYQTNIKSLDDIVTRLDVVVGMSSVTPQNTALLTQRRKNVTERVNGLDKYLLDADITHNLVLLSDERIKLEAAQKALTALKVAIEAYKVKHK